MAGVYMTDYGPVRVSEPEARLLQIEEDARRGGFRIPEYMAYKICALKVACDRVAKFKASH